MGQGSGNASFPLSAGRPPRQAWKPLINPAGPSLGAPSSQHAVPPEPMRSATAMSPPTGRSPPAGRAGAGRCCSCSAGSGCRRPRPPTRRWPPPRGWRATTIRTRFVADLSAPGGLHRLCAARPLPGDDRPAARSPSTCRADAGRNTRGLVTRVPLRAGRTRAARASCSTPTGPVLIEKSFLLEPEDGQPARIVVDLVATATSRNLPPASRPMNPSRSPPSAATRGGGAEARELAAEASRSRRARQRGQGPGAAASPSAPGPRAAAWW